MKDFFKYIKSDPLGSIVIPVLVGLFVFLSLESIRIEAQCVKANNINKVQFQK